MSGLSDKYNKILTDIEEHISKEEEKRYVIRKVEEISSIYMELIDRITKLDDERIEKLEERQEKMINTISKLQETVNLIKSDIYEDDSYDFEIVCPYCNHEFVADIESELKEEVECPECHNIIELDWDDEKEEGCDSCHAGHCSTCGINSDKDDSTEVDYGDIDGENEDIDEEDIDEDVEDNIDDNDDDM